MTTTIFRCSVLLRINHACIHGYSQEDSMKKLYQLFVLVLLIASFATASTASAASICPSGYTGPDKSGICTSETAYTCELNQDEEGESATIDGLDLSVSLSSNQDDDSGLFGTLTTGDGVTFTVTSPDNEECFVTTSMKATVTQEPAVPPVATPSAPAPVVAPKKPTVLANTSADSKLPAVVGVILAAVVANLALLFVARRAKR